uniref:Protein FAM184A/B N-terminal domain-containing protein n=1 Tax=Astatotilapia calliptera TaxID=8154 RepID=A0AAX7V1F6_ASTCA
MATGAGWQPPYNTSTSSTKYPPCTTSSMLYDGSLTLEYTQDLHLKMSKKIAQLTKVIYALNTKNDEHEEEIESLKEAHEDEVQHIVTETRDKIMQYKTKMADEVDLRRRLASLEESVELHEHMKRQALAEFEMYRQRMEDSQLCTEAQHTQRVVSMSREVEEMRRDFEEKLRSFSQAQAQFEAEKRRALEELRTTHRQEVEELLNNQRNQSASSTEDQEKLAELHRQEVEALMERVEELTKDKVRLVEEYEAKLAKAQEYYERELEAMRRTHQLTTENLLAWKRTEVKNLHKQLEEAIQDGEIWVMQLKDTEYELESSRERVQQQATEILHKASQIGSLQATQMAHEATIRNLDQEQSRLKEKISRLEEEREVLLSQSQTANDQHKQQVLKLEQSLREEHQGYEKELSRLRAHYEEETLRFKEAQVRALEELEEKHQVMREEAHGSLNETDEPELKMSQEFEIKRLSLEEQRDRLQQQLDNLKEELSAKLNMANQEVSHLQELVREGEQNLNSAQMQITCLKETQEKLKIELDATRARVRETSNLLTDLQISLLKQSLELQLSQSQSALQQLQSQFNQERELLSQQLKGMHALEERLKQEQREEVHALKEAHRRTLEILRQQSDQELQTLRFELEDEGKAKLASLRAELNHLHATAIEHLKQIHLKEHAATKRELEKAMEHSQKQEQDLLIRISDLQAELCSRSNRITDLDHEIHSLNETIDTLTRELELKGKEVLRVRSEANHQIRAHEQDLAKRHEREMGELNAIHQRETQIMLADFNKAQEVLKDKISALQILLEGTEEKLRNRESRPEDLHVIAELREMVTEREALVKKLVDDKKFYQLELVNRETGFNKVFNSSANVGVINPLIKVSGLIPHCFFSLSYALHLAENTSAELG